MKNRSVRQSFSMAANSFVKNACRRCHAMTKIYLRAGHGGIYTGTTGNGLIEKTETLKHILTLADQLSFFNVEIKLARSTDATVELASSIREANVWGADLYYSSHINGFSDSGAYGYESYVYTAPTAASL